MGGWMDRQIGIPHSLQHPTTTRPSACLGLLTASIQVIKKLLRAKNAWNPNMTFSNFGRFHLLQEYHNGASPQNGTFEGDKCWSVIKFGMIYPSLVSNKHKVSRHKQQYCCARTGQTCQTGVALAYCMDYHIEHVWNQMVTINPLFPTHQTNITSPPPRHVLRSEILHPRTLEIGMACDMMPAGNHCPCP